MKSPSAGTRGNRNKAVAADHLEGVVMSNAMSTVAEPPVSLPRVSAGLRTARLVLPALLLLIVFFLLPVLSLLLRSVLDPAPGVQNYSQLFGSTTYLRVFGNTFFVASVVTAGTLVIRVPTALLLPIAPPPLL